MDWVKKDTRSVLGRKIWISPGGGAEKLKTNPAITATPAPSSEPPTQPTLPQKILILAAIPHGLRLDREIREIEEAIRTLNG
jgi:hypothetical protein